MRRRRRFLLLVRAAFLGTLGVLSLHSSPVTASVLDGARSWFAVDQVMEGSVEVRVERAPHDTSAVTVEWLRVDPNGAAHVIAQSVLRSDGRLNLRRTTSDRDTTLVRFSREGASPVSVPEGVLSNARTWRLPGAEPGGEIFARLLVEPFVPLQYRVMGVGTDRSVPPEPGGWLAIRGLKPGQYTVRPYYRGGLEGQSIRVRVQTSRSAYTHIETPPTGGLTVTWDAEMCHPAGRTRLINEEDSTQTTKTKVARELLIFDTPHDCHNFLEGLRPGAYLLTYEDRADGLTLSRPFVVSAGDSTVVSIDAPEVNLTGRVARGGRSIQGDVEIRLRGEDAQANDPRLPSARVSPSGAFALALSAPGRYRASLIIDGVELVGVERALVLTVGHNTLDWELPPGQLTIRLPNWDHSSPVVVRLRTDAVAPGGIAESEVVVRPGDRLPVVVEGLGFHTYQVRGSQERVGSEPLVSAVHPVQFSETRISADVSLELLEYTSVLRVRTSQGLALEGATVTVGEREALSEVEPGVFALNADVVQPGSPLVVSAAGYAPACIPAPTASSAEVRLDPGRQVRFIFTGLSSATRLSRPPGTLFWQGSFCGVPMRRFDYRLNSSAAAEGVWVFDIQNMPSVSHVTALWDAFDTLASGQRLVLGSEVTVALDRGK